MNSPIQTKPLKDILTKKQIHEVGLIMNRNKENSITRIAQLTAYCNTIKEDLLNQDIDPDFMAYALDYALAKWNGRK